MSLSMKLVGGVVALGALVGGRPAGAQEAIESRLTAVAHGTVRFTLAAADGVCGNGAFWSRARDGRTGMLHGTKNGPVAARDVETTCDRGPVRVVVERERGDTKAIRVYVGGRWRPDTGVTELGAVSTADAGRWLLRQAERGPDRVARGALQAAMLADSVEAGASLLRLARDDSRSPDVRQSAVHWLSELVGDRVSATLDSIAYDPGDRDVRRSAIFALARRPREEALPALQQLAESLPDRELRRAAITALAQTRDPQALSWLEQRLGPR